MLKDLKRRESDMYDYQGSMSYYQDQLTRAGITQEELNMYNYVGLTSVELQSIVNNAIANKEREVK